MKAQKKEKPKVLPEIGEYWKHFEKGITCRIFHVTNDYALVDAPELGESPYDCKVPFELLKEQASHQEITEFINEKYRLKIQACEDKWRQENREIPPSNDCNKKIKGIYGRLIADIRKLMEE